MVINGQCINTYSRTDDTACRISLEILCTDAICVLYFSKFVFQPKFVQFFFKHWEFTLIDVPNKIRQKLFLMTKRRFQTEKNTSAVWKLSVFERKTKTKMNHSNDDAVLHSERSSIKKISGFSSNFRRLLPQVGKYKHVSLKYDRFVQFQWTFQFQFQFSLLIVDTSDYCGKFAQHRFGKKMQKRFVDSNEFSNVFKSFVNYFTKNKQTGNGCSRSSHCDPR